MMKASKRLIAVLASAGIFACSMGTYNVNNAKANEIIYNDSNVSICSAIDRYIATNDDAFEDDTVITTMATLSDAEPVQETTGSISLQENEVVATATGNITEVAAEPQTQSNPDFEGKALVAISDVVNIRAEADVDSERVGSIGAGGLMTVVEQGDEWSLVTSGNCEGYIKNEFIVFGDDAAEFAEANLAKVVVVEASALKLRADGSEDSECLTLLAQGEEYHIISQGDEWTEICVDDTLSGYVKNEYVSVSYNTTTATTVAEEEAANQSAEEAAEAEAENEEETESQEETETETDESDDYQEEATEPSTEQSATEEPATEAPATEAPVTDVPVSELGVQVANYALQFVGNPYVYGGTSLTNGADCSGFVMKIYENFGYSIPRTADVQGTVGMEVSLSALAPGDLVFYDHGTGSIKHVGLYIGNGQIVHASNSRTGIIVSNAYYSTPCKAVRIIY